MKDILRAIGLLYAGMFFVAALVFHQPWDGRPSSRTSLAQVGGVGVMIGVAPNPDNTLAQQFRDKEAELQVREKALLEEEKATQRQPMLLLVLIGEGVLLVLVLANFYMDHRERRRPALAAVSTS